MIQDWAADAKRTSIPSAFSRNLSSFGDRLYGWMFQWPVSISLSLSLKGFYQIRGETNPALEMTVCLQFRIYERLWEITRECLISGQPKNKDEKTWKQSGGRAGVWVKQLLFKLDTVSWGLLGCSPLKVLQSLNLSHIQSLRWRVHRKTWKRKKIAFNGWDRSVGWIRFLDLADGCLLSPRRLGSARTIFCFFFFFPEVTVSKRCCWPLVWLDW